MLYSWTVLFDYKAERKNKINQSVSLKTINETFNDTYFKIQNETNIGLLLLPQTVLDIKFNWVETFLLLYIISFILEEFMQVRFMAQT